MKDERGLKREREVNGQGLFAFRTPRYDRKESCCMDIRIYVASEEVQQECTKNFFSTSLNYCPNCTAVNFYLPIREAICRGYNYNRV